MKTKIIAVMVTVLLIILIVGRVTNSYLPYYNKGNEEFENNDYEEAIKQYEEALNANYKEDDECDIRVNLALAMLKSVEEDFINRENIENVYKQLEDAKKVLTESDCARDDGNGHDTEAQKLYEDIDKMLEEIEKETEEETTDNGEDEDGGEEESINKENIKEMLKNRQDGGMKERKDSQWYYKNLEEGYDNWELEGKVW